jgi:protein-S-isoprenylcysteine O-methyltransferase Ste14
MALLLLIPAGLLPDGTWTWRRAWIALAVTAAVSSAGSVGLAIYRPENFAMRQQGLIAHRDKRQPLIDVIGLIAFLAYLVGWLTFIPFDVFQLRLLAPPDPAISIAGGVAGVAGLIISQLAVAQNRFATPTIHDQSAEGQRVIDTGLYSVIRHPLYTGNLLVYAGLALWLGSTAAFAGALVLLAFTLARIVIEENHLRTRLPAYADYEKRVRSRLIPFLL